MFSRGWKFYSIGSVMKWRRGRYRSLSRRVVIVGSGMAVHALDSLLQNKSHRYEAPALSCLNVNLIWC